jgi:hypothetical protein
MLVDLGKMSELLSQGSGAVGVVAERSLDATMGGLGTQKSPEKYF